MTQEAGSGGRSQAARSYVPRGHPISWLMLVVTTGAILINSIDRAILPAVLPGILSEFDLSESAGGFLVGLSFAGTAIGGLILGIFGDSLGKGVRRAWGWAVAVAIVVVSSALTAVSQTLAQLQVLRVAMGIGTGGMEPVNVAMVGEWWQKEDRGFAVGTHHTGFPIGQFVGTLLIGAVVAAYSWREAFLFIPLLAMPIVVLQIVLARRRNLRRVNDWILDHDMTPSVTEEDLDEDQRERPLPAAWRAVRLALAERNVRLSVIVNFLFLWAETAVVSFLTLQLTREAGLSLAAAVTISGASGITGWMGQIFWGTVSDHKGRKFSLGHTRRRLGGHRARHDLYQQRGARLGDTDRLGPVPELAFPGDVRLHNRRRARRRVLGAWLDDRARTRPLRPRRRARRRDPHRELRLHRSLRVHRRASAS